MQRILHLKTRTEDGLAAEIIAAQERQANLEIVVIALEKPDVDYAEVVRQILAADSVCVW